MSQVPPPIISIIVAVFNGKATLQQCIDSVAQQSYPNKELIVIDGGSIDGSVEILKANQQEISYWISEPDSGIYNAWNKGVAQAKGEWIYFLGSDDYFWDPQALERVAQRLKNIPDSIRISYGQVMVVNAHGEPLCLTGEPWQNVKERFRQVMCLPHQGVMHRRSLFEQYGKFDESFRIAGDYEFLLRELRYADAFFIQDCIVAAMRVGGIGSTHANSWLMLRETRRASRIHGQRLPGRFFLRSMAIEFVRRVLWKVLGERSAKKFLDQRRRIRGLPPYWTST